MISTVATSAFSNPGTVKGMTIMIGTLMPAFSLG